MASVDPTTASTDFDTPNPPLPALTTATLTKEVLVGVSSWSDRSLTHESSWYPKRSMTASERIDYYCNRFGVVEMETSYRFAPSYDAACKWVERTPDDFKFDLPIWSLLVGQRTMRASLWDDLNDEVKPTKQETPNLYASHLSAAGLDECWKRFVHGIGPLADSGKLGTLIAQMPRWFVPRDRNRQALADLRERLGDLPVSIEFANAQWLSPEELESTLDFLDGLDLGFVCVDGSSEDPRSLDAITATSSDLGVIRLRGRADPNREWSEAWRSYRYNDDELQQIQKRIERLAGATEQTHVLVGTCWRDDAVVNATNLDRKLHG